MGEDLDEASRMLDNAGERLYVLENELECKDDEIERLRAEIAKLRAANISLREWISEAINELGDPCDASDFNNSETEALLVTMRNAIGKLKSALAEQGKE